MPFIHENKNLLHNHGGDKILFCMQDTEQFNGTIFFYPTRKDNINWYVNGVFCSLSCVKGYILDNLMENSNILTLFTHMCQTEYKKEDIIIAAPPQFLLRKFHPVSGGFTLNEFRCVNKHIRNRSIHTETSHIFDMDILNNNPIKPNTISKSKDDEDELTSTSNIDRVKFYPSSNLVTLTNFIEEE